MPDTPPKSSVNRSIALLIGAFILAVMSYLILAVSVTPAPGTPGATPADATTYVVHLLAIAGGFVGAAMFIVAVVRIARAEKHDDVSPLRNELESMNRYLKSINERLQISDGAKRVIFRENDREALRSAIREDIKKGEFDAAIALVEEMGQTYGYREEAEAFRDEIIEARSDDVERRVTKAIADLEQIIKRRDWERAMKLARKIQRLFPDSMRVIGLDKHVREAKEEYKMDLERRFLEAAQRDDVELAMELLKELDIYLTEEEAEPFRETARGVIGKKRENLGVQFKLAVQDGEWMQALRVGEQIVSDFPNSKMAGEVRTRLAVLRAKAAGQRDREAMARETV